MSHLEWTHDGRRIVLPILILRPEASDLTASNALALLDTGATTSGIVRRIADALDLAPAGKRPIYIARGLAQVERHLFRVGLAEPSDDGAPQFPYVFDETLGFELSDTTSLPDGRALDAVLGMDVLRSCHFTMQRDGKCRLAWG